MSSDYRTHMDADEEVKERLPSAFDVIGDVAIIRLRMTLRSWRHR